MQPINFFDDPFEVPKPREEVRFKQIGLFVYEYLRRVAVGFDLEPFLERPCIEVAVTNDNGQLAGALTIIETLERNFSMTMHLRDKEPTETYHITATIYYQTPDSDREDVYTISGSFPVVESSEHLIKGE